MLVILYQFKLNFYIRLTYVILFQMQTMKLQSSDGDTFEVDVEIAKQSVTIKTMLEDLGMCLF